MHSTAGGNCSTVPQLHRSMIPNSNTHVKNIHHLKSNAKMYNSIKVTALHTRIFIIYRNHWALLKYENKNLGCIVIDLLKLILIYP